MYKDYTVNKQINPELLEGRRYRKLVEKAQKASDSAARSSRRQTLEYAESMNIQREMVYSQRNRLIDGTEDLDGFVVDVLDEFIKKSLLEEPFESREELYHFIVKNISFLYHAVPHELDMRDKEAIRRVLETTIQKSLQEKRTLLETHDFFSDFQRLALLKAIDDNWVEQVDYLQQLSLAIGGQSAAQKNPIVEYYQEAYHGFEEMKRQVKKDMVRNLLLSRVDISPDGEIMAYFP